MSDTATPTAETTEAPKTTAPAAPAKTVDVPAQIVAFVKKTRGSRANGKSFPRIVLFSPIAHEDTHNPNVPDGKEHNVQLEAYTKATEVAGAGHVTNDVSIAPAKR